MWGETGNSKVQSSLVCRFAANAIRPLCGQSIGACELIEVMGQPDRLAAERPFLHSPRSGKRGATKFEDISLPKSKTSFTVHHFLF